MAPRGVRVTTQGKVQAGFGVALACLIVIGLMSLLSLRQLEQNTAWVEHTGQVLDQLHLLVSAGTDAETAERGYIITRDASYLEPFESSVRRLEATTRGLRGLTLDNPDQQRRLAELAPLLAQREELLRHAIELERTQDFDSAQGVVLTGESRRIHQSISAIVAEMAATESSLLRDRERRTRRSTQLTQATIIGGALLALGFVALALLAIRRDFAGRQRAEQALSEANLALESRVRERTAELSTANDALVASERRFRALLNASSDVIYRMSPDWGEMYHLEGKEFIPDTHDPNRTWLEKYIHPADQPMVLAAIGDAIRGNRTFELEHRVRRTDGSLGWTHSRAVPLMDDSGAVTEWFGAARDVSERKLAEVRLRAQVARLALLDSVTRAIAERQDVRSILQVVVGSLEEQVSVEFACICLYEEAERRLRVRLLGQRSAKLAVEVVLTENAPLDIDGNGLGRCVRGELVYEPDTAASTYSLPMRLARAGLRSLVLSPLTVQGKPFGIVIAARSAAASFSSSDCEFLRQLSEHLALAAHQAQLYASLQQAYEDLRQSQQTVMQQERLRALGQMASGIAHDINNSLSPASIYAQMLLDRDATLSPQAREFLDVIRRAIDDVGNTVGRMRMFYRPRESELTLAPVDLNLLVQQVTELTRARWSAMPQERGVVIELRKDLATDLPPIMGAESEIRDALTNLVLNAVDAMPQGGTLTVRTQARSSGAPRATPTAAWVEVCDSGIGMSEAVRSRCLEPFYTTKGERGTGLGLAMVYGMVQRHSAELEIESEPGSGTTVRVSFPVTSIEAGAPAATATAVTAPLRILLVDDDPLLLKSLSDVLRSDGHQITASDGGQRGIAAFHAALESGEPFAVVITDLGMPNVDGRAVATAIKSTAPGTPVILLTGWGQRLKAERELPEHVDRVLSKPPRLAELRAALAELAG